jgi:acetyl esterase/lipase
MVTSILLGLLILVVVLWLLGLWIRSGEDLSSFDRDPGPEGGERFESPDGPSVEHQAKVAEFEAMAPGLEGRSRKEMLQFTREFMEELPAGKSFGCEFRPVTIDGVSAEWVLAPNVEPGRRVLYLHGGAFIAGSPNSHHSVTSAFSRVARAAVLAVDYRLMPEHQRRAGIEDCRAAYRWIIEHGPDGPGPASRLFMGGDSAGGNLSLMLSAWARDQRLRPADAVVALSPLTDSTYSGPSIRANLETDAMLGALFGKLLKIPKAVLGWLFLLENRVRPSDPLVSPVRGDLSGLPPTLVQVSASEMLFDDARRYVNKARAAGSPARLQAWSGLLHVWHIFHPEVPEARDAFARIENFLNGVEENAG